MARKFRPGDVYAPHDLTGIEANKYKTKAQATVPAKSVKGQKRDIFDVLGIDPLNEWKVYTLSFAYWCLWKLTTSPITECGPP
jgi:small subunit ribosomal protein S18